MSGKGLLSSIIVVLMAANLMGIPFFMKRRKARVVDQRIEDGSTARGTKYYHQRQ